MLETGIWFGLSFCPENKFILNLLALSWQYSIICGGEQRRGEEKQSSVSICIDVPASVAASILGTVDADYTEDPIGFSFSFISFTTAVVFVLMTYVYVKGFVCTNY
ncbi:hypothetical protein Y032_0015g2733 [Ancylostoma ceylanicum]|uniref:Uncharacterized protein n=1 Tax=Ancylostoma ceylanicum TaxID=53326 RepID=A0A016V7I1_9BILA|nr:hypothetical protein Y032_0015g2733 [Ancylostoma ceylanicum]